MTHQQVKDEIEQMTMHELLSVLEKTIHESAVQRLDQEEPMTIPVRMASGKAAANLESLAKG